MNNVVVKKAGKKGKGLFAARDFEKGQIILHNDMTKIKKKYTIKEIRESGIDSDHWDYIGRGKYILDYSPESYVNHSCDPNSYIEFKKIGKTELIAKKPIKKGEEITKDYQMAAMDQIDNKEGWEMKCECGSKKCRKIIRGDFFKLPKRIQKGKLSYLPNWIKRKYRDRIKKQFTQ